MTSEFARIVRAAIRSWPETFRLCVIVLVVAATTTASFYFVRTSVLFLLMK